MFQVNIALTRLIILLMVGTIGFKTVCPTFAIEKAAERIAGANTKTKDFLKGSVSASESPFLYGCLQTMPKGTKIDLTLTCNLNSELSQKGDEVFGKISVDVKDGENKYLPAGWYMHGFVTNVQSQRRAGRDGFVEVEFDKIISPDGQYELPFQSKFSTADSQIKKIAKVVAIDTGYISEGALGGALLSVQLTGIPMAIATHGYSIAIGAGVGAGLGAIGALKRKGNIASLYPSDEIHLSLADSISIPGVSKSAWAANTMPAKIKNLDLSVVKHHFGPAPFGDKQSRLLTLKVKIENHTDKEYGFFDLAVVSDHGNRYYPSLTDNISAWKKKVQPGGHEECTMSFSVDSPKHKYWLVLLNKQERAELTRTPIN